MQVENYADCYICKSEPKDAEELFKDLRIQDQEECWGLGVHPLDACRGSIAGSSKTFTIRAHGDNALIACFGSGDTQNPQEGCIWMLGTNRVKDISLTFLKHCKKWIEYLVEGYAYVSNVVSMNNKVSMRWLKWVGATFMPEDPIGYREFIIHNPRY